MYVASLFIAIFGLITLIVSIGLGLLKELLPVGAQIGLAIIYFVLLTISVIYSMRKKYIDIGKVKLINANISASENESGYEIKN